MAEDEDRSEASPPWMRFFRRERHFAAYVSVAAAVIALAVLLCWLRRRVGLDRSSERSAPVFGPFVPEPRGEALFWLAAGDTPLVSVDDGGRPKEYGSWSEKDAATPAGRYRAAWYRPLFRIVARADAIFLGRLNSEPSGPKWDRGVRRARVRVERRLFGEEVSGELEVCLLTGVQVLDDGEGLWLLKRHYGSDWICDYAQPWPIKWLAAVEEIRRVLALPDGPARRKALVKMLRSDDAPTFRVAAEYLAAAPFYDLSIPDEKQRDGALTAAPLGLLLEIFDALRSRGGDGAISRCGRAMLLRGLQRAMLDGPRPARPPLAACVAAELIAGGDAPDFLVAALGRLARRLVPEIGDVDGADAAEVLRAWRDACRRVVPPPPVADRELALRAGELVRRLDSESYRERESARKELLRLANRDAYTVGTVLLEARRSDSAQVRAAAQDLLAGPMFETVVEPRGGPLDWGVEFLTAMLAHGDGRVRAAAKAWLVRVDHDFFRGCGGFDPAASVEERIRKLRPLFEALDSETPRIEMETERSRKRSGESGMWLDP